MFAKKNGSSGIRKKQLENPEPKLRFKTSGMKGNRGKGEGIHDIHIGDKIRILNENGNYDEWADKIWTVNHIAHNSSEHRGYDEGVGGLLIDAKGLPVSLYEYEFEKVDENEQSNHDRLVAQNLWDNPNKDDTRRIYMLKNIREPKKYEFTKFDDLPKEVQNKLIKFWA